MEELQDEAFPPGLDFECEPSIASHDPLDDDLVPECPPPDVFPEDVPAEDEDPIHGVTSGVAVTASIACDAATVLPQDHVQELFQESFHQGGQFGCLGATATPEKKNPKHSKGKHDRVGKDVLFELACANDSNLRKVGPEHGVKVIRLCKEDIDLENLHSIEQLIAQVDALPGCSIHCSVECKPWSQWQHLNQDKYPMYEFVRKEQRVKR